MSSKDDPAKEPDERKLLLSVLVAGEKLDDATPSVPLTPAKAELGPRFPIPTAPELVCPTNPDAPTVNTLPEAAGTSAHCKTMTQPAIPEIVRRNAAREKRI